MKAMKCLLLMALTMTLSAPVNAQKPTKATTEATRCIAITQKGNRCKCPATKNGYCTQHARMRH